MCCSGHFVKMLCPEARSSVCCLQMRSPATLVLETSNRFTGRHINHANAIHRVALTCSKPCQLLMLTPNRSRVPRRRQSRCDVHAPLLPCRDNSCETIVFACGGTGGHITPALAVAGELQRALPKCKVKFWGNKNGLESIMVPAYGFQFEHMQTRSLLRPLLSIRNLWRGFRLILHVFCHVFKLLHSRATAVVGTGGFVAFPACLAAAICRKPLFLIEPNAVPGLSNRLLAPLCTAVFTSHACAGNMFPKKKVILSGTPLRAEFSAADRAVARQSLQLQTGEQLLTVVGGSSGSDQISSAMRLIIQGLLLAFPNLHVHHQCGPGLQGYVGKQAWQTRYHETDFFQDMAGQFAASDLVLARSGALTCAELLMTGVPSVLWPLVPSADDHQQKNAEAMHHRGASVLFKYKGESSCCNALFACLADLLRDHSRLARMGACARTNSHDATYEISQQILLKM
eukprot:jgi/Ulvmu1/7238/UM035_0025.1